MTAAAAIDASPRLGRPPLVGAPVVPRPRLTSVLSSAGASDLIALVAPAGYGKTTLLCDWAARDGRSFAWVRIGPEDDDPAQLEASVASALRSAWPRRGGGRLVLVLDDLQVLTSPGSQLVLARLVDTLSPRVTLAVASRTRPGLPLARLRAERRLTELGPADLALNAQETEELVQLGSPDVGADDVAELWSRTEGWPAAAALGALSLGDPSRPGVAAAFGGHDRLVADYLRDELLRELPADDQRLMLETAVLDTLSGSLCDHVLRRTGSAAALSELAREHLALVPLDRRDEHFRHHRIVAEMLRDELQRRRPARAAELHRGASDWHAQAGERDLAIRHAVAAGDVDRAVELVWSAAPAAVSHGRKDEVERWLARFSEAGIAETPLLALARAGVHLASGHGRLAEHWAWAATAAAPSPMPAPVEAGLCLVRAALTRGRLADMGRDAERAFALEPAESPRRASCRLLAGTAAQLAGRPDEAAAHLDEGARRAGVTAPDVHAACLTQLALLALAEEDWEEAAELVTRARAQLERYGLAVQPPAALTIATSALVRARRGRVEAAQQDLDAARQLRERLIDVASWYEVQLAVVLARCAIRLSDLTGARDLLADAARTMRELPDATALASWLEATWAQLDLLLGPEQAPPSSLTTAELRILRFLPTHLSFREIADRVYVSANTVKSQANAIYRKLDASGRSEAVSRARQLGLLDA